jgi:hypothetical protein
MAGPCRAGTPARILEINCDHHSVLLIAVIAYVLEVVANY